MVVRIFLVLLLTLDQFHPSVAFVNDVISIRQRASGTHNNENVSTNSAYSRSPTWALSTAASPYLKTTHISEEALQRFRTLRKGFPDDANIVKAGGWYNLERLAVDPKQEMVSLVVEGLKSTNDSKVQFGKSYTTHDYEKLEALELLLYGMGKGFEADLIDGEWDLVFTKQGKKSPAFQKLVGKAETAKRSKNLFDIKSMTFGGDVQFWKYGKVSTKVKYEPSSESYSKTGDGKIVLRRIDCQIVKAFVKWWKLPGLPLPRPKRKGYLDIVYLDHDIRVTRGNRGGFFVHFRPSFLEKVLST